MLNGSIYILENSFCTYSALKCKQQLLDVGVFEGSAL